jgi:hypothetical protein
MTQRIYLVLMEDAIIHTADQPICDDPDCICAQCEYDLLRKEVEAARREARRRRSRRRILLESKPVPGSLDGNRPFSLLR